MVINRIALDIIMIVSCIVNTIAKPFFMRWNHTNFSFYVDFEGGKAMHIG